jgi:hypothetical protein
MLSIRPLRSGASPLRQGFAGEQASSETGAKAKTAALAAIDTARWESRDSGVQYGSSRAVGRRSERDLQGKRAAHRALPLLKRVDKLEGQADKLFQQVGE